jgi:two-component system, sensor histidine kinase
MTEAATGKRFVGPLLWFRARRGNARAPPSVEYHPCKNFKPVHDAGTERENCGSASRSDAAGMSLRLSLGTNSFLCFSRGAPPARCMFRLIAPFVNQLDAVYRERPYFIGIKARLLATLCVIIIGFIPFNVLKLLWVQPPYLANRLVLNLAIVTAAWLSLRWARRGRIELAGNVLVLGFIVPAHGMVLFSPTYPEPLSTAVQLLAFDLVYLIVSLVFASRRVAWLILGIIVSSHVWFHYYALHEAPLSGSLDYAADTLLRDGLLATGFTFFLGLTLVHMIEAAHRRSEQALRATQATNENLERLVADRTVELEAASQRAQESSRAKSEFLANMSHEIRTPLNGIVASADLLRQRPDLPDFAAEHMRLIAESGDLLLRLLGDILDFSKIEAGQLELEQRPFPLGPVIADTVALLAGKASSSAVHLGFSIGSELPRHVNGDSHRLRQVLLNLTANAIKFTPSGGEVHVVVSAGAAGPESIRFEVNDTGIGMDEATVARIFERFTQADSSTTRRFGGSGLGLAISSHLVNLMGGKIDVQSELGRGSKFYFSLPLPRVQIRESNVPDPVLPKANLCLQVLVVEDHPVNQKILIAQLKHLGCHYTVAEDGAVALTALSSEPLPDIVLMDGHMPNLDGWETTRQLRAWATDANPIRQRASALPIVALTAAALPEERRRCLDAGMNEFLSKPAKLAELQATLLRYAVPAKSV